MTIRPGELPVVTGVPGSGKSEFIDALAVNLAFASGWRFALCSFENPPTEHVAKLAEKYSGTPFSDGQTGRMSELDLQWAMDWIADRFFLIRFDDEAPTIQAILEKARGAVMRHGIRGLVIDPYNKIEHRRPMNMTDTGYVSQLLGRVKRFAQHHGCMSGLSRIRPKCSAPTMALDPIPTLYDISGAANWVNKADLGIVVHRDPYKDPNRVEIQVRKVRFKSVGKIGGISLRWDRASGQHAEITAQRAYAPRAYAE
jgi:twinkle protein